MLDLKARKTARAKGNRRKREQAPVDWRRLFHRLLRVSVFTGSAVLLAGGALLLSRLVFESDYFHIETVSAENLQRVSREEILALSDVRPGSNIFDLDLQLIGRKLEENPWVASARVERVFPREVRIHLVERVPLAIIHLGYLYYVDADGEVFKLLETGDSLDLPVITGIEQRFLLENPQEAKRLLGEAAALFEELSRRRVFGLQQVSELHVDQIAGFSLHTLIGGVPVRLGYGNFAAKLDRLEKIFPELQLQLPVLKYIDLNVADRVIVQVDATRIQGKG